MMMDQTQITEETLDEYRYRLGLEAQHFAGKELQAKFQKVVRWRMARDSYGNVRGSNQHIQVKRAKEQFKILNSTLPTSVPTFNSMKEWCDHFEFNESAACTAAQIFDKHPLITFDTDFSKASVWAWSTLESAIEFDTDEDERFNLHFVERILNGEKFKHGQISDEWLAYTKQFTHYPDGSLIPRTEEEAKYAEFNKLSVREQIVHDSEWGEQTRNMARAYGADVDACVAGDFSSLEAPPPKIAKKVTKSSKDSLYKALVALDRDELQDIVNTLCDHLGLQHPQPV